MGPESARHADGHYHLELVDCVPYNARLTERACRDRYLKAQTIVQDGRGVRQGQAAFTNGSRRRSLALCADCSVGKARLKRHRAR